VTDNEKRRLRVALAVMSGRKTHFEIEDMVTLGYDRRPPDDALRKDCEDVVFDLIERALAGRPAGEGE